MQAFREYDHRRIEQKWQAEWADTGVYRTSDDAEDPTYILGMFPYPSGELHMGHVRNYTITDAYAHYRRMQGDTVLHPMGWDAFGLPAENAAIENDTDPHTWTMDCIERMREQLRAVGFGYDWDREITTCTRKYYRWNQWLFNRFDEAGLVERKARAVNWCPSCETVLADEQVDGDACWRCDSLIEECELDQWFLKITDYADELVDGLSDLEEWPESVRSMQRDWIGRQEGASVNFEIEGYGSVAVFTTRIDTIYGVSFIALAPDHEISRTLAETDEDVRRFVEQEADPEGDTPKGVETGLTTTNPVSGGTVPVYVADFVLSHVGTGALMGVPGHDERDHAFASENENELSIIPVVAPDEVDIPDVTEDAYTADGVLVHSGEYTGMESAMARERLIEEIEGASEHVQYRLRDWGISRQRYWGTPIPVVHCPECGPVTVPDEDLPVELPEFISVRGNPLDAVEEFVETTCPECGAHARRETDTMDTFVDSSWYFLRFVSPDSSDYPFDSKADDWLPVDLYVGGVEHAVMHLLYARFVTRVFSEMGLFDHREPFAHLLTQGMVRLEGEKMSKSTGNVVSPQHVIEEYGADTARLFTMQTARPERDFDWTETGVRSIHAFLERLHDLVIEYAAIDGDRDDECCHDRGTIDEYVAREIDATIVTARDSYESLSFVDALRESRELVDLLCQYREYTSPHALTFERGLSVAVKLLSPVTPHLCEELWAELNSKGDEPKNEDEPTFVIETAWPEPEPEHDAERYELARRLVEETREDVRQIIDVAGIDDPEHIEIVVAPEWKHHALEIAIETDREHTNVIGEIMADDTVRTHGETAADYATHLQSEHRSLSRTLSPEREFEALSRASWLTRRKFDADVLVLRAEDADEDLEQEARPGRPAIRIE